MSSRWRSPKSSLVPAIEVIALKSASNLVLISKFVQSFNDPFCVDLRSSTLKPYSSVVSRLNSYPRSIHGSEARHPESSDLSISTSCSLLGRMPRDDEKSIFDDKATNPT